MSNEQAATQEQSQEITAESVQNALGVQPETQNQQPTEPQESNAGSQSQKDHQPPPGSPRFKQVYGELKQTQRNFDELKSHNQRLEQKLDELVNFQTTQQKETRLADIERRMDEAVNSGDTEIYVAAKKELREFMEGKTDQSFQQQSPVPRQAQAQSGNDNEIFKQYNPWYGVDQDKTRYAHQVNDELLRDPSWNTRSQSEFLAEVSRRTNQNFSLNNNQYRDAFVADGITNAPTTNQPDETVLTKQQRETAINLFPDLKPEEAIKGYKKQLDIINAGGE